MSRFTTLDGSTSIGRTSPASSLTTSSFPSLRELLLSMYPSQVLPLPYPYLGILLPSPVRIGICLDLGYDFTVDNIPVGNVHIFYLAANNETWVYTMTTPSKLKPVIERCFDNEPFKGIAWEKAAANGHNNPSAFSVDAIRRVVTDGVR